MLHFWGGCFLLALVRSCLQFMTLKCAFVTAMPSCKHLYIMSICCIDACTLFSAYTNSVLLLFIFWMAERQARDRRRYFLPSFRTSPLAARLRGELCGVSRLALHRTAMPNIFCPVFIFLLACFWRLSTLLPPLCVILVFTMCFGVLLLCLKSHTQVFIFLLGLDNF